MMTNRVCKASGYALAIAVAWMLLPLLLLRLPFWDWPISNWSQLSIALVAFMLAFGLGGIGGLALMEKLPPAEQVAARDERATNYWPILLLTILINIATLVSRASFNPFTCGNILECSNAAYQGYVEGAATGAGAMLEYVRILLSPFIYAGIAVSVWLLLFPRGRSNRRWAIATILTEVTIAIATGTSRNLANIILFGLFLMLMRKWIRPPENINWGRRMWLFLFSMALMLMFFFYFSFLQLNRDGLVAAVGLMGFNGSYIESLSYREGSESVVLKGLESVVRYLSTGYFSFSLALDFVPQRTFPIGSSLFLSMRMLRGGDDSYVTNSLPGQIESHYGWSYTQQWHSLFSWLLSDYSMVTISIFMALCGFLFVIAIYVAFSKSNPMSKLPIMIFFIFVLYVPANNQLFQSPETIIAFFFSIAILSFEVWRCARLRVIPAS